MQKSRNKDGKIIGTLIVINKNEIAAAKEALKKSTNPEVIHHAKMLKKQHTQNLNDTIKLSKRFGIVAIKTPKTIILQKRRRTRIK